MTSFERPARAGSAVDALLAGGAVGADLLAVDWDATPLGRPETWPQSLTTIVQAMLGSRFSMWMAWGPELTFFCNDAYRRDTLGEKYPWALGRPAREVWSEIWADIGPRIDHVMATGEATWDESLLLFLERSGYREETYHTFSYSPLTDDGGQPAGMLCVVSEETERVVAERRMAILRRLGNELTGLHTEDQVMAALRRGLAGAGRSLPFALVYLGDDDGALRLRAAIGIEPGHAAAPPVIDEAGDGAPWPAGVIETGRPSVVGDLGARFGALPTGDWDEPPTAAIAVPLANPAGGRAYGFLVAAVNRYRPLDDEHRAFISLVGAQLASGLAGARAYESERERAEQLAELDRAKTAFFTNVSHELRTPLTLLLGPAEDALADAGRTLPDADRRRLEVVHRNGQRLLKLVNTLLDFSRLESGRAEPHREWVALGRYTAELASMFESAFARAGVQLRVDCPLQDEVPVDREMWAKIVLNLVSNALKFTFDGAVTVRLDRRDGMAELTVADTGMGIPPEEVPRLFDRFHRVAGARARSHEGSGIGLALVAELAQLHGGAASVDSSPGQGSRFTVRVPLAADGEVAGASDQAPAGAAAAERQAEGFVAEALRWLERGDEAAADGATAGGDGEHVLVVDDNPDMRHYVAELLGSRYRVAVAADGVAALDQVRRQRPDLVIADVMMPRMDGFELLQALRADPETMQIPVVMLSARGGEDGVVEGLEAGADDYLVKPFSARELLARVAANLELDRVRRTRDELARSRELLDQAEQAAQLGSWEIDLASRGLRTSAELARLLGLAPAELAGGGLALALAQVHPDDVGAAEAAIDRAIDAGEPVDVELRIRPRGGGERLVRVRGRRHDAGDGTPLWLRGSLQDITEQRRAERAWAEAVAQREAAAREHRIADELQRSLLPPSTFAVHGLDVAACYRAGAEGTRVGGDWYDAIELAGGRTALVIGDVMGRGVQAAAVMGQVRAAMRAYASLPLSPSQVLGHLDGVVAELGAEQLVTCVYAIYDPAESTLTWANAGHLPPLLASGGAGRRLAALAADPPLGCGGTGWVEHRREVPPGALLALYTDGLVERRNRDIDHGIARLEAELAAAAAPLEELPDRLLAAMTGDDGPDDDAALLLARLAGRGSAG